MSASVNSTPTAVPLSPVSGHPPAAAPPTAPPISCTTGCGDFAARRPRGRSLTRGNIARGIRRSSKSWSDVA
jgi:hypothetical protein